MRDNVRFRVDVIAAVHHVDLGPTSLSRSLRLYQELLGRTESLDGGRLELVHHLQREAAS